MFTLLNFQMTISQRYTPVLSDTAKNMPQIVKSDEVESALDIYVRLARRHACTYGQMPPTLEHAVDVIRRNFRRIHPLNAIECCLKT